MRSSLVIANGVGYRRGVKRGVSEVGREVVEVGELKEKGDEEKERAWVYNIIAFHRLVTRGQICSLQKPISLIL